jgi:arylsulfatase A-like enzyme
VTAVVVGLLDATLVNLRLLGAAESIQYVPMRIWLVAPAAWLLVAAVACAIVLPLPRRWGGILAPALLAAIFAVIRLRWHVAVLAGGLAALAVLLLLARGWLLRWMATPRPALAAAIVAAVIVSAIGAGALAPRARESTSAKAGDGPNVIVIFLDTVRYDAVFDATGRVLNGLPTLARLRAGSVAFTRVYSASSWTLPSHLSAVTGLPAAELGVSFDAQVYDRRAATLAERFRAQGYRTAAVISNSFLNAGSGFARGYDTFEQAQSALDLCRTAPGSIADAHWPWFSAAVCNWTASEVTRRARAQLDDAGGPFFLTLNYMDAHDPYYVERSCGEPNGYAAALRCLDRRLAPIVDWRSPRRPTVLVVAGDHGEQFGEHGLVQHGNSLYVQVLHVPLIVRGADGAAAGTNATPLSLAVLASLAGAPGALPPAAGPVLSALYPPATARIATQWSAIDGTWHLIVRDRGAESLYHLPSDPAETRDLSAEKSAEPAVTRLRSTIDEMRRVPAPDLRKFRSLGYIH